MYSEKLMEHFENPHNVGILEDADAVGEARSSECGDMTVIYLKLDGDTIRDVTFQTYGCATAIASSSVLTDLVRGMKIKEALCVTKNDIEDALDGVPPNKVHCSMLAQDALKDALHKIIDKRTSDFK